LQNQVRDGPNGETSPGPRANGKILSRSFFSGIFYKSHQLKQISKEMTKKTDIRRLNQQKKRVFKVLFIFNANKFWNSFLYSGTGTGTKSQKFTGTGAGLGLEPKI